MSTQQDIYAAGSENRPPMLNKENYVPWSSRLLRYAKSRPNGKLIYNSIMNGPYVRRMIPEPGDADREVPVPETFHEQTDDELTEAEIKQMEADDQAIQTILLGLPEDIYAAVDSCETAQEIWLRVQQMMKGSDIGIQEKKAKLFNEWERFTSTDGESIESYYHRFSKLMNDFKRNKHFPEKIASNLKFLNNLQPEWSRHVTIVHQTKDLHTTDYTQLYDFLKYNQKEVDDQRAERLAKTHDPLALMANSNNPFNYPVFHQDQPSPSTYMQQPQPINNNYNPQPSFNQNYMQQPMPNPEDITDPTTAMNMALALMAKAFKLNYSTPTNNNQRISSNPRNRQIAQPVQNVGNQVVQDAVQNQDFRILSDQRRRVAALYRLSWLIAQKEETGIQLQAEEFDLMAAAADLDKIEEVNANCILMANLQQASTSGTQTDKAPVYDSDGSAEVHHKTTAMDNEIFNMFTQEEQYTELLEPIPINALHLSSGKQITTLNEEISKFKKTAFNGNQLFSSLLEEKKKLKSDFKIREDELLDKQIQLENKIKELDNILVKTGQSIQTMHMLSPKPDSFYHTEQKMALGYQNPFYLKQAQRKQQSLYNGKVLLEKHDPPVVHDSEETLQLAQESRLKMKQLNKEIKPANYTKINHLSGVFVSQSAKSQEEVFVNTSKTATVSKSISIPNEEFLDDTTLSVARKFLNEVKSTIVTLQRVVKHRMTLDTHNWSSIAHQEIHKILKEENFPIINQVDTRLQNFEIQFLKEAAKFVRDFKSLAKEADESLAKHKTLELEIERLLRAVVSQDIMSIVQNPSVVDSSNLQTELDRTKERLENCIIKKENEYAKLWNDWYKKCEECKYDKILYDKAYNDMQQKIERLQAQLGDQKGKSQDTPCVSNTLDPLSQKLENENVELEFQVRNYEKEIAHLKTTYKNLFDSISVTRAQTKTIIDSLQHKLHDTIYENAKLRAQLFDKVSEQVDTTKGTSTNTKFANQSTERKPSLQPVRKNFVVRQPNAFQSNHTTSSKNRVPLKVDETNDLSKPVTSNSVPTPQESKNVIAPGMFRINPFKPSREEKYVPNKVRASVRTTPITVSQPHVVTKKDVNSDSNGLSSTGVDNTAKTRRPQPRSNTKNDRVPSASKSSCNKNKEVEVEEHHRNLLLSKNKKHMSSECKHVKLDTRNDQSEVICAMCKQCLITANHDVCMLNYVNDMNSRGKKQKANVSNTENQKKQKPKVIKPKKVGSNERLASPKPSKPRFCLRWSPTGRLFDIKGKIIASSESESQSDCSNGDNACTSNPSEPTIKRFPNSTSFLGRLSKFFLGTVRFGNDHVAAILGFGDLQWGNILITRVYFVEGLGHNLFSGHNCSRLGQFCDSDFRVCFQKELLFCQNLDGVDLLHRENRQQTFTPSISMKWPLHPLIASWLEQPLPSHGLGINVYPAHFDTSMILAKNDLVQWSSKNSNITKNTICPSCGKEKKQKGLPLPSLVFAPVNLILSSSVSSPLIATSMRRPSLLFSLLFFTAPPHISLSPLVRTSLHISLSIISPPFPYTSLILPLKHLHPPRPFPASPRPPYANPYRVSNIYPFPCLLSVSIPLSPRSPRTNAAPFLEPQTLPDYLISSSSSYCPECRLTKSAVQIPSFRNTLSLSTLFNVCFPRLSKSALAPPLSFTTHSKIEAPEVIKPSERITVLLQLTCHHHKEPLTALNSKNQTTEEYFDSVGISHQASSDKTPQQNGVVERRNRTLVEAARTMLIFFSCTNDREDIGKLGAKGDIGFFIGFSATSCAYRVYNRRKKKIMETMNVSFDELARSMAFEILK
ncbi:retrovirus-related pol polyprotein from transposon TNT 1-94 [Tanacetum coccineum]